MSRSDAWEWCAEYDDGTLLHEYDDDGTDHGFAEIDQARLVRLLLVPGRVGLSTHTIERGDGETANFWRRRPITLNPNTGEQTQGESITIVCIERPGTAPTYTILFHDGSIAVSTDFNAY